MNSVPSNRIFELTCFVCNNGVEMNVPALRAHFKNEHPKAEKCCDRCKKSMIAVDSDLFYLSFCKSCNKREECKRCHKLYQKSYMKKHKEICDGKDNAERTCKGCGETKNRELFYESKYTCIACLNKKLKCDVCNKEIIERNMKRHKQSHEENKENKQIKTERRCNNCNNKKSLDHFSMGKYTCKECLKQKIECSICHKIYARRYESEHKLRNHSVLS